MNPELKKDAEKIMKAFQESPRGAMDESNISPFFNYKPTMIAVLRNLEENYNLIMKRQGTRQYDLTKAGWNFTSFKKLEKEQREKEELEKKKLLADLDLAEKTLKDYPKTKCFAIIGLLVSSALAIVQLLKWFNVI